jgi:hypothetical protein
VNFLRRLAFREGGGGGLDYSSRLNMFKSRASPDMPPSSHCNKKRLAIRLMNKTPLFNDTNDSVLRYREIGRAKDLSALPHINRVYGSQRLLIWIPLRPLMFVLFLYMLCRPKQRPCDELRAYRKSPAMCVCETNNVGWRRSGPYSNGVSLTGCLKKCCLFQQSFGFHTHIRKSYLDNSWTVDCGSFRNYFCQQRLDTVDTLSYQFWYPVKSYPVIPHHHLCYFNAQFSQLRLIVN